MSNNQPSVKHKLGNVSVAVWENTNKEGKSYKTYSLSREHKDLEGKWQNSTSFFASDFANIAALATLILRGAVSTFKPKPQPEDNLGEDINMDDVPF